jgi:CRP/FNR family cyclic AMP-dependent transcriptional regulator
MPFEAIAVLQSDPDLAEDLTERQAALARERVLAEVCSYPRGKWAVDLDDFDDAGNMGLLIIDGLMTRDVTVAEYTCAELLGPGDIVPPWLRLGRDSSVTAEVNWQIVQPIRAFTLAAAG